MRNLGIAFVLLVAGCGSDALPAGTCSGLSQTDCANTKGCAAATCSVCGQSSYNGCYDPARDEAPGCPATGVACKEPCSAVTTEAECGQRSDCRTDTCPDCNGGHSFIDCAEPTDPAIGCGLDCPAPACSQLGDATSCNARAGCHAVFQPLGACGCATAGCCIHFDHCADGQAACTGQPACAIPSPICDGPYVVSYTNACYEGCVLATECH